LRSWLCEPPRLSVRHRSSPVVTGCHSASSSRSIANIISAFRLVPKDAGGSRTHFNRVAAGRLAVWLQRRGVECPRQELNLILDLRRVVCESVTLRGLDHGTVPRQGIGPCLAASKTAVRPTHSRGAIRTEQCPRQESNLVDDLRRVACESGTLQGLLFATLLREGFAAFDQSHGIPHYFRSLGTLSEKKLLKQIGFRHLESVECSRPRPQLLL
jgi:hypothetical protein